MKDCEDDRPTEGIVGRKQAVHPSEVTYSEYLLGEYCKNPVWEQQHVAWIQKFKIGGRVLDAGAGFGHFALACQRSGAMAIGVEKDGTLLASGRARLGFTSAVRADVCSLPFAGGFFDWVVSNQVIEHVEAPGELLREALRVLRPGGRLLVTTPNRRAHFLTRKPNRIWLAIHGLARSDPTHVREFVPRELRGLIATAGFVLEREEPIGRNASWPIVRIFAGGVLILARKPMQGDGS